MPGTLHTQLLNDTVEVWGKALADDQVAVMVVNVGGNASSFSLAMVSDIPGGPTGGTMRDVWEHKNVAVADGTVHFDLDAHDSALMVFSNVTSVNWWNASAIEEIEAAAATAAAAQP